MGKKALEELVFHDDFMFAAVMMDAENCRCFLERVLEMKIGRVEISREHGFFFNPENKSIRMDVFAKDEDQTHYDIEMQLVKKDSLERRSRYYHSQMDMELLTSGAKYENLPNTYVIFICDFDPFSDGKYRYRFRNVCKETGKILEDGAETIFLNTRGKNPDEVSEELVSFLEFVRAGQDGNFEDFGDTYVTRLQNTIRQIKENRGKERQYMMWQDIIDDAKEEGRQVMIKLLRDMLSPLGTLPDEIIQQIDQEKDLDKLSAWVKLAAKAESLKDFISRM